MAVSFSSSKRDFIGKEALGRQFKEMKLRLGGNSLPPKKEQVIPMKVVPMVMVGAQGNQGIARQGDGVFMKGEQVGHVTSGTMIPYWVFSDEGILSKPTEDKRMRSIGLAYIDSDLKEGDLIEIQHSGKTL